MSSLQMSSVWVYVAHTFSPPMTANGGKRDFTRSLTIAGFTDWCEQHKTSMGGLINSVVSTH